MSKLKFDDLPDDLNKRIADHMKLYLSDPAAAHMWDARPVGLPGLVSTLLLTTIGRKSGKPRHVPLLYVDDGDGYLIIGSKGGYPDHPLWFKNLMADPDCEIRVGTLRTKARAVVLEGAVHDAAWAKIVAQHPVYAKYQERAPRQIPVIRLEPVTG